MPNPFSLERNTPKTSAPRVPCTPKRGYAHNWLCDEPSDGKVVAHCRYCRRKREYPAYLSTYEMYMAAATLSDPKPKRTVVGETSDYR